MNAGVKRIRPPGKTDITAFMRMLFLRTEQDLINEINRKRRAGLVEYAEAASLERVQQILQGMVDESWEYVPKMIETIFYHSNKDVAGYRNARVLTTAQTDVVQQLSNNLLGELTEASETAFKNVRSLYTIARLKEDPFRDTALKVVLSQEAAGSGWSKAATKMAQELQNKGITAFVDRAGRHWSLQSYGNMAVRTTARQAQIAAILTADDYDLWQIVKIGSTCPVCAPLEGRVYSKSGTNPDYPPLSLAFGKIDPGGPDDLTNTYLNIHPNCLHAIVKYTTIGKTEKQIRKDKDFSSPEKNPLNRDPRTKKQIAAYREKERNRRRLLTDMKEHKEYRAVLGNEIPKDFAKFREIKYNDPETFGLMELDCRRRNKLLSHPELRLPNAENAILPEGKFTKYLFGGTNADGLSKGKAFESRLGYNSQNWKELKMEIKKRASLYPVTHKGNVGFGDKYEQKIVLYGKKGRPANAVGGWIHKPDGTISMTSAYIKEK